jgi:rhomboid family GlyGly-CTERM serine protease
VHPGIRLPWPYIGLFVAALVIQLNPDWRELLIYRRSAVAQGELWRLWTGHLVHFGWPHFLADGGLLLIMGWTLGREPAGARHQVLLFMPLFVSAVIFWFDPGMERYGGLSALDLGLLLMLAIRGWQRNWTDWFWPAVLLIYAGEIIFEILRGGQGGGMITFDDPTVRVATSAHLAATVYVGLALLAGRYGPRLVVALKIR